MDDKTPAQLPNTDLRTVAGFGEEWSRFQQDQLGKAEAQEAFDGYFRLFPWDRIGAQSVGIDIGCGSGRWAERAAPRVGTLHALDASEEALAVARRQLAAHQNIRFHHASVSRIPLPDGSLDFAYSLGVLHHVPDTNAAFRAVAAKLKSGAPFLTYLYYSFENRPASFRAIWRVSDSLRRFISAMPAKHRHWATDPIAVLVYFPLARAARLLEMVGLLPQSWPLADYRALSFYAMRTDALDRFGTPLEKRFSRAEIAELYCQAGFVDIEVSTDFPYWCAIGTKA
ncbi:class I SAM-dependent methyltransferase [Methylocystis sp.]|uniref:class I SAM-dependent methyltransferase n=1 Tax=Methylocystis sp. TaxID=1911079 RepID=UPI003DA591D4